MKCDIGVQSIRALQRPRHDVTRGAGSKTGSFLAESVFPVMGFAALAVRECLLQRSSSGTPAADRAETVFWPGTLDGTYLKVACVFSFLIDGSEEVVAKDTGSLWESLHI